MFHKSACNSPACVCFVSFFFWWKNYSLWASSSWPHLQLPSSPAKEITRMEFLLKRLNFKRIWSKYYFFRTCFKGLTSTFCLLSDVGAWSSFLVVQNQFVRVTKKLRNKIVKYDFANYNNYKFFNIKYIWNRH